jgi:hypothetical protein
VAGRLSDRPGVRAVPREEAVRRLRDANESAAAVKDAVARGHWHVAGQEAILAAIAANDALLGLKYQIGSSSAHHLEAVGLLRDAEKGEKAGRMTFILTKLVRRKSKVMYYGTEITEGEARELVELAAEFMTWVKSEVWPLLTPEEKEAPGGQPDTGGGLRPGFHRLHGGPPTQGIYGEPERRGGT